MMTEHNSKNLSHSAPPSIYKMNLLEELDLDESRKLLRVHEGWILTTYFENQFSTVFIPENDNKENTGHHAQEAKKKVKDLFIASIFLFVASLLIMLISYENCSAATGDQHEDQSSVSTQQPQSKESTQDNDPIVCKNMPNKQQPGVWTVENQSLVRVCKKKSEWAK